MWRKAVVLLTASLAACSSPGSGAAPTADVITPADVAADTGATADVRDASTASTDVGVGVADVVDASSASMDVGVNVAAAADAPSVAADVGETPSDTPRSTVGDVAVADAALPGPQDAASDGGDGRVGTVPPDFMLPDLNPASASHRMTIIPSAQRGAISVWYFASAT